MKNEDSCNTDVLLGKIFDSKHSVHKWLDKKISNKQIEDAYNHAILGPTSMNSCPMRGVLVTKQKDKENLESTLSKGNENKVIDAPVTAILACDLEFYNHFSDLKPNLDIERFKKQMGEQKLRSFAENNAYLQIAYFMIALRALDLDCSPMGGFDAQKVNSMFFSDTKIESLVLLNIGYGDVEHSNITRAPRLSFQEAFKLL